MFTRRTQDQAIAAAVRKLSRPRHAAPSVVARLLGTFTARRTMRARMLERLAMR